MKKIFNSIVVGLGLLLGSIGVAQSSSIEEVLGASHKLYRNNQPICSGTIVNTPKMGQQLFVTSAHCLIDLDNSDLWSGIAKAKKDSFTIKYIIYNDDMFPTVERTYHLELFNDLIDPNLDMALLSFRDSTIKLPAVDVASDEDLKQIKIGDDVAAIGFPLGYDVTITKGQFSGKKRSERPPLDTVVFRYTAPSTFGNSGGGLYKITDGDYKYIGTVSHVLDGTIGKGIPMGFMNFAIPALHLNSVMGLVDTLLFKPTGVQ